MCSISSAELAVSVSGSNEPGCEPSLSVKSTPSPERYSATNGRVCRSIETSKPSQPRECGQMELTLIPSGSSVAASPARTSAKQSKVQSESTGSNPASLTTCSGSQMKSAQGMSSSKTPIVFATSDWIAFSGGSMLSGMMRNGMCSELPTLGRRIVADASTLWPTPTASRRSGLQSHGKNALLGPVNPVFLEWLMGFPINHTSVEFLETPSSRKSRKSSGGQS